MNKLIKRFDFIRRLLAILIALTVGFLIILILSDEPIGAIGHFILGPLTKVRYMGNVIEMAIPLVFSGLSLGLLFETKLFNLGAEGIFYFCGLIAAIIGINFALPAGLHPAVAIMAAAFIGSLIMGSIGYFKAKWDTNELVLSLMFNSIFYGLGLFILNYYFRAENTVVLKSEPMLDSVRLTRIISGTRIHSGLIIAALAVLLTHWMMEKTTLGYEIKMTGSNIAFALYSGIDVKKSIIVISLISGALAGMGGAVEVTGMYDSFKWVSLPGLGFDGALIAMLAKNKPLNVPIAALFLAYIRIGADLMSRLTDIPAEMVGIMQGLIILLISAEKFLQLYRERMILKEVGAK